MHDKSKQRCVPAIYKFPHKQGPRSLTKYKHGFVHIRFFFKKSYLPARKNKYIRTVKLKKFYTFLQAQF